MISTNLVPCMYVPCVERHSFTAFYFCILLKKPLWTIPLIRQSTAAPCSSSKRNGQVMTKWPLCSITTENNLNTLKNWILWVNASSLVPWADTLEVPLSRRLQSWICTSWAEHMNGGPDYVHPQQWAFYFLLLPTLLTSPLNPNVTLSIQVENKANGRSISEVKTLTCKLSSDSGGCCWQDATVFSWVETLPW